MGGGELKNIFNRVWVKPTVASTSTVASTACFIATADPPLYHYYSSYSYTIHLYY